MHVTFAPSLLGVVDSAVQEALGAAASVVGQQFDVRRLDGATNGSITNNAPVLHGFPAILHRTTSKKVIEGAVFDLVVFEAECDAARYLVLDPERGGDLLKESIGTPGYTGASYTFVQRRPPGNALLIRTDVSCSITRPKPKGGRADQQPVTGSAIAADYLGTNKAAEWNLTLSSGAYAFASTGSSATVMIGLQPTARVRDGKRNDAAGQMPTDLPLGQFIGYVPLVYGETIQEKDILNCGNADRYEVRKMHTSGSVGVVGWVVELEKLPL